MEYALEILSKELDSLQYKIETLPNCTLKQELNERQQSIMKVIQIAMLEIKKLNNK